MTLSVAPHKRKRRRLTPHEINEVAVKSFTTPRTVERYLDGGEQHSTTKARIAAALAALGLAP